MNKTFIKGALYILAAAKDITILKYVRISPVTKGTRFERVAGADQYSLCSDGLYGFLDEPAHFRRAYHYLDLLTPKDRQFARGKADALNGKFEDEVLRHMAARRAKLRKLTAILGGEYYAKQ